jgi:hypothetical protein
MRYRASLPLLFLAFLSACGEKPSPAPSASLAPATLPAAPSVGGHEPEGGLAAGQTWRYRTRPEETGSMLRILMIEDQPTVGRVVHVSLTGLHIRRKGDPPGRWDSPPDLKFSEAAIKDSITELVGAAPAVPDPAETAAGAETARGQVFLVPVNQAVDLIERGLDP